MDILRYQPVIIFFSMCDAVRYWYWREYIGSTGNMCMLAAKMVYIYGSTATLALSSPRPIGFSSESSILLESLTENKFKYYEIVILFRIQNKKQFGEAKRGGCVSNTCKYIKYSLVGMMVQRWRFIRCCFTVEKQYSIRVTWYSIEHYIAWRIELTEVFLFQAAYFHWPYAWEMLGVEIFVAEDQRRRSRSWDGNIINHEYAIVFLWISNTHFKLMGLDRLWGESWKLKALKLYNHLKNNTKLVWL